jgi:CBS domain-containing protein
VDDREVHVFFLSLARTRIDARRAVCLDNAGRPACVGFFCQLNQIADVIRIRAANMIVRDVLKAKRGTIMSVRPESNVSDAIAMMVKHDIGSVLVLDGARLVGLLTFREVLAAVDGGKAGTKVIEVMLKDPPCGNAEDPVEGLRELMNKDHIRYLPVREGEKLLGVISYRDVANAVIKETSFLNRLFKTYIKNWPEEESAT